MKPCDPRPVLFLDIDDVLCVLKPYSGHDVYHWSQGKHPDGDAVARKIFAPTARKALLRLNAGLGGQLRFVISSTWRLHFSRSTLCRLFELSGLSCVSRSLACEPHEAWCTPRRLHPGIRAEEIQEWLEEHHCGQPIAVVDDIFSGRSLLATQRQVDHPLNGRFVLCQQGIGLERWAAADLLAMLRHPLEHIPPREGDWQ